MRFSFEDKKLFTTGAELEIASQALRHIPSQTPFRRLDMGFLWDRPLPPEERALDGPVQGLFIVHAHAVLAERYSMAIMNHQDSFEQLFLETADRELEFCTATIASGKIAIQQAIESAGGLPSGWPVVGTTGPEKYVG